MNILDPDFKYVPAAQTDLSKSFARIRRRLKEEEEEKKRNAEEAKAKVAPLAARKAGGR